MMGTEISQIGSGKNPQETPKKKLTEESVSVQTHLQIIQGIIQRMANNSTSCKSWCITIVSAVLILVADKGKPDLALLAIIPSIMFILLDAYYLALERMFRNTYNDFVFKLHEDRITAENLYSVTHRKKKTLFELLRALTSFSIWGFYGFLIILIVLTKLVVITSETIHN